MLLFILSNPKKAGFGPLFGLIPNTLHKFSVPFQSAQHAKRKISACIINKISLRHVSGFFILKSASAMQLI